MIVCHCRVVTDCAIADVAAAGATTVDEVTRMCGAGGRCGGCVPTIAGLLAEVCADAATCPLRQPTTDRPGNLAPAAV